MTPIPLPTHPRILVLTLRRLGDVLFATPLIASLRRAWPQARIDALVFDDTAGILAGNPDINDVIAMPPRPTATQSVAVAARIFKRYDLAVSTQSGDRPTAFALLAGRRHVGPVDGGLRGRLRQFALWRSVPRRPGAHQLDEARRLAEALGIEPVGHLVCPGGTNTSRLTGPDPYAVVHAAPNFTYKRWPRDGWRALAAGLRERGLGIMVTGGPAASERTFLDEIWGGVPGITRLDGRLGWPELTALLGSARAYVGPDTSVTHLAAASGCPTVALYGPTDPRLWGPVPAGGLDVMWAETGTIQRRRNVWLVQNPLPCLPCHNEGCERHVASYSRCLDELSPALVLRALDEALGSHQPPAPDALPPGDGATGQRPLWMTAAARGP